MEVEEPTEEGKGLKEYQTLFWVPMLFNTAKQAESLIEEMLDMIQDFHDTNVQKSAYSSRRGSVVKRTSRGGPPQPPKRRQQIFGEAVEPEPTNITRMDIVMKSDSTKLNLLTVLKRHFLFSQLRDTELDDVVDVMQLYCASESEIIIRQGDQGETFYILEEGTAELFKDGVRIADIDCGNSFGDLALMYNSPRAATITAKTFCTLWTLDRVFFRQAMITSSSNQYVQLSQFLQKISLFANVGVAQLNQLARSLTKQSYEDGQYIIRQGEVGDQFYVVFRGKVVVSQTDDGGNEKELIALGEGEVFGERALIKKEPRKANVKASGTVECYYLESHDFHLMLGEFVEKFNKMNEFRIIRSAKIFYKLNDYRLKELITQFTTHRMFSGQRVVCGTGTIFIVIDGSFLASNGIDRFASDGIVEIGSLEHTADEIAGALTVVSDEGTLASFTLEQLQEAMKRSDEDETRKTRRSSYMESRSRSMIEGSSGSSVSESMAIVSGGDNTEREIRTMAERRRASAHARRTSQADFVVHSLEDLDVLQPLGKGTFGTVFLCEYHHTANKYIALKCLDKRAVVESGQHNYVRREIIALSSFSHPFLGEYFGCILSRSKICFMLEFIPGGELWSYLYDEGVSKEKGEHGGIPLLDATLYAGNIILALEHMHTLGYTYRDLKPENLMVHANGYLKLVDFGFAKQVPFIGKAGSIQYRTFTLCGTPDYMAPELVLSQGHDGSVDYWAYGTLLYELVCGHTPFDSSNQQRTFEKIVHSQKHLSFPSSFDPHCKSLIRRLLHPNGALRIGALQNGIEDIKTHAFFTMKNLNFDALEAQELEMPYLPQFELGKNNNSQLGHIEPLDVEFELRMDEEDEYNEYFAHLNDPDLIE